MPTTKLIQATGEDVFDLFPGSGPQFTINGYSETNIDDDVTNNPKSNTPKLVLKRWKTILTDGGFDSDALDDDDEYPFAWKGMRLGIVYEFLKMGRLLEVPCTDSGWPVRSFDEMMKVCRSEIAKNLYELGINSNSYYNPHEMDLYQFDTVNIYKE